MVMFEHIEVKSSVNLDTYLNEMSEWGDIGSLFYELEEPQILKFDIDTRFRELSSFIGQVKSITKHEDLNDLTYTVLNRLEFQGSLATKYVQGGIHGRPTPNYKEALDLATELVDDIFPFEERLISSAGYDEFFAYKIENDRWCNLLNGMVNWSYIVNDFHNHRWWFIFYNTSS